MTKLSSAMKHWGAVGVSLDMAHQTAHLSCIDPSIQRRIRCNLVKEEMKRHHKEAARLQRKALRLKRRANLQRQANRKHRNNRFNPEALWEEADNFQAEALKHKEHEEKAKLKLQMLEAPEDDQTLVEEDADFFEDE